MKKKRFLLVGFIIAITTLLVISQNVLAIKNSDDILNTVVIVDEIQHSDSTGTWYSPDRKYIRDYLGSYENYFSGKDILMYAWKFNSRTGEASEYKVQYGDSDTNDDEILNAINSKEGASEDILFIYCAAKGRAITNLNSKNIGDIIAQRNVYKSKKVDLKADTFTGRNGQQQSYQGLAYILAADLSGVSGEKAQEDARQDAIWSTEYNKANGGNDLDGEDDRDTEATNESGVLTTPYSSNNTYPGLSIEKILESLRNILTADPEAEIEMAADNYENTVKEIFGKREKVLGEWIVSEDDGHVNIFDSVEYDRNLVVRDARFYYDTRFTQLGDIWTLKNSSNYKNESDYIKEQYNGYSGGIGRNVAGGRQMVSKSEFSAVQGIVDEVKNQIQTDNGDEWNDYLKDKEPEGIQAVGWKLIDGKTISDFINTESYNKYVKPCIDFTNKHKSEINRLKKLGEDVVNDKANDEDYNEILTLMDTLINDLPDICKNNKKYEKRTNSRCIRRLC